MGLFARFRKNRAISSYLEVCAPALQARYGAEEHYAPARIMTTLNAMDLNVEHREYACALFASASDFIPWARVEAKAITFVKQTDEKLRKRYDSLRAEVAEKYNGGSFAFLPRPESLDFVSPLRDHTGVPDADRASGFRWYR